MPPKILTSDTGDRWLPVAYLSARIKATTSHPGPGHRGLVALANNATISPPMERRGDYWGCWESRIPELADRLGLLPRPPEPTERRDTRQRNVAA